MSEQESQPPFTNDQLIAYVSGDAPEDLQQAIERACTVDENLRAKISMMRGFLGAAMKDAIFDTREPLDD